MTPRTLLTTGNPKGTKGEALGWFTALVHLAPADRAGVGNVCPWSTPACRKGCLNTAGRGGICRKGETTNNVQKAREARTRLLFADRSAFLDRLEREMHRHVAKSERLGLKPCFRLNGTSDLPWEAFAPYLMHTFPKVQFYDYTKGEHRLDRVLPDNYHLTLSRSETNEAACIEHLERGHNVAVVFRKALPSHWRGFPVIDGDQHDLRFLDAQGVVVGLKAKGKAKGDRSGFVVD